MGQLPDRLRSRATCSCSRVLGPRLAGRRAYSRGAAADDRDDARRPGGARRRRPARLRAAAGRRARRAGRRDADRDVVVPVTRPARCRCRGGPRGRVVLHTAGAAVVAPPSETPDGWVHWRVAPALSGYRPSPRRRSSRRSSPRRGVRQATAPRRGRRALVARLALAAADVRSRRGPPGRAKMVRRPRGHFSLAARPHPPSRPGPVVRGHRPRPEPCPASTRGGHYGVVQTTPAPPRPCAPSPMPDGAAAAARRRRGRAGRRALSAADKARDLRRMKMLATGLLLGATVVFLLARWGEAVGAPDWVGYVRATAEAAMVGALADWFAVTALFRRPMGLPIPHTAIIPRKKDQLGDSLGDFVGENFLAEDVVRDKLGRVEVARRVGEWIGQEPNADSRHRRARDRRTRASSPCCATRTCRRSSTRSSSASCWSARPGPPLGTVLEGMLTDGSHHRLVDLVCDQAYDWVTVEPHHRAADRRASGRRPGRRASSTGSSRTACSSRCRPSPGR